MIFRRFLVLLFAVAIPLFPAGQQVTPGAEFDSWFAKAGDIAEHMVLPVAGACPAGTLPIYRVFSARPDANHRYMTDPAVRDAMVGHGWVAEGDGPDLVVMCSPA